MSEELKFKPDQVVNLNTYQVAGRFHPFTCPNRNSKTHRIFNGDLGALVATVRGWICPWCDYTQEFAHDFMCEPIPPDPVGGMFPRNETLPPSSGSVRNARRWRRSVGDTGECRTRTTPFNPSRATRKTLRWEIETWPIIPRMPKVRS